MPQPEQESRSDQLHPFVRPYHFIAARTNATAIAACTRPVRRRLTWPARYVHVGDRRLSQNATTPATNPTTGSQKRSKASMAATRAHERSGRSTCGGHPARCHRAFVSNVPHQASVARPMSTPSPGRSPHGTSVGRTAPPLGRGWGPGKAGRPTTGAGGRRSGRSAGHQTWPHTRSARGPRRPGASPEANGRCSGRRHKACAQAAREWHRGRRPRRPVRRACSGSNSAGGGRKSPRPTARCPAGTGAPKGFRRLLWQ